MKPWLLFVVGGFVGVIGLILLSIIVIDNTTWANFNPRFYWVILLIIIVVWILSGLSSRLTLRWEKPRSKLIATIIISFLVGPIFGLLLYFVIAVVGVIITSY